MQNFLMLFPKLYSNNVDAMLKNFSSNDESRRASKFNDSSN